MSKKGLRITYWIVTVLFAGFMLMGGVSDLMQSEEVKMGMIGLGYPVYLLTILGVAKVLGVIAILQTRWYTIKEWAYAGFSIDIIGASASIYASGASVAMSLFPLVFLAVMFVSYYLWKKTE